MPRGDKFRESVPAPLFRLGWLLALLAVVAFYFAPFFFQGRHIVPFNFERPISTGIPGNGKPLTIHQRFPGHDNSPILIHYPNAALTGQYVREGELPTWNPYVGTGQPAMGNGQVYPFSPFLWPFYLFPNPWVFTFCLILGTLWGAWGAYLWLARFRLTFWARCFGALACMFNPWTVKIILYSDVWAAWWFGWLLWSWDDSAGKGREKVVAAGRHDCGHGLHGASGGRPPPGRRLGGLRVRRLGHGGQGPETGLPGGFVWRSAAVVGLAGLMTAVHWMPVLAHLAETAPYKFMAHNSVTAGRYLFTNLLNPRSEVFVNPVLWGLIFLGLAAMGRNRRLVADLALLGVVLVACFQVVRFDPFVKLITLDGILPGIYARGILWFGLAPLLAAGAESLLSADRPAALSFASSCWGRWPLPPFRGPITRRAPWSTCPSDKTLLIFYAAVLLVLLTAAAASGGWVRRLALAAGLAALVVAPRVDQGLRYAYFNDLNPTAGGPPAIARLKSLMAADHQRFASEAASGWHAPCLSPDLASLWRVRDVRVVDVLLLRRFAGIEHSFRKDSGNFAATWLAFGQATPAQLGLLAVRYYGIPLNPQRATFRWEEVPDAMPRAYLVHSVIPARDEADSLNLWEALRDGPELHSAAILEGWRESPAIGRPSSGDRVSWIRDGLKQVELKVETPSPAVLVLLDAYANGWVARVDGRRVPIFPANLAFRGVKIPPGSHVVSFRYQPPSVILGEVLAGAGWLAVLLLLGLSTRRRG